MRVPRVRFTVRRVMVAVAFIALVLGLAQRSRRFARLAERHGVIACPGPDATANQVLRLRDRNEYEAAMSRKYRLASWLPSLPVAPDPPQPN